jgi:hypothetical protein
VIHYNTHFAACVKLRSRRLIWPGRVREKLALTGQVGSVDGGWNVHTMYVLESVGDGFRRSSCSIFAVSLLLGRDGGKGLEI